MYKVVKIRVYSIDPFNMLFIIFIFILLILLNGYVY